MAAAAPLVKLDVDDKQIRELERVFRTVPKAIPVVMAAGINDTLAQGRTQVKDDVAAVVNLKKGYIAKHMRLKKATRQKLSGAIHIGHKPVPLIEYASKAAVATRVSRIGQQGPQIRIRVRKNAPQERKSNRFVTVVGNGHVGVFKRTRKGRSLPIQEEYGPSVTGAFQGAPGVERRVLAKIHDALGRRIHAQMNLVLEGKRYKQYGRALGII